MLRDRGYSVPESELARTLPEFRAWWAEKPEIERLGFSTTLASDLSKKVQIVFRPPEPVKIATIREIYGRTKERSPALRQDLLWRKYFLIGKMVLLPRMLETDAVARYYGLGKGTVVRVTYDNELTGNHVTYRCIF